MPMASSSLLLVMCGLVGLTLCWFAYSAATTFSASGPCTGRGPRLFDGGAPSSDDNTTDGPRPAGRIHFMTYGDCKFAQAKHRLVAEAQRQRIFDAVFGFGPEDVGPEFRAQEGPAKILRQQRGGGYWLWKPYLVHRVLTEMDEGDLLVYADAGCELRGSLMPLVEQAATYGLLTMRMKDHTMDKWTKGAVFRALGMDPAVWGRERQIHATAIIFQKRPSTMHLVRQWLHYASIPELITDEPSDAPDPPAFIAHRHDQAIWSLLCYKYRAQLVVDDSTWPPDKAPFIAGSRRRLHHNTW